MSDEQINNVNVLSQELLPTPAEVKRALPLTPEVEATVLNGRETIQNILTRDDPRLFVVVGPCSIHDARAALEYAERLRTLQVAMVAAAHMKVAVVA